MLIPDYATTTQVGKQQVSVVLLEGKIARNAGLCQIWDDLTKLGQEMKVALDSILKLQPEDDVCVIGVLVRGMFCTVPVECFEDRLFISSLSFMSLASVYPCFFRAIGRVLYDADPCRSYLYHAQVCGHLHCPWSDERVPTCPPDGGLRVCQDEGWANRRSAPSSKSPRKPKPQSTTVVAPALIQETKALSDCRWTMILRWWYLFLKDVDAFYFTTYRMINAAFIARGLKWYCLEHLRLERKNFFSLILGALYPRVK